jgi:hypothetical protein
LTIGCIGDNQLYFMGNVNNPANLTNSTNITIIQPPIISTINQNIFKFKSDSLNDLYKIKIYFAKDYNNKFYFNQKNYLWIYTYSNDSQLVNIDSLTSQNYPISIGYYTIHNIIQEDIGTYRGEYTIIDTTNVNNISINLTLSARKGNTIINDTIELQVYKQTYYQWFMHLPLYIYIIIIIIISILLILLIVYIINKFINK